MELNFDKEIDALLRQTAQSGDFVSNQTVMHLDADEISAFAENALPEKTRQRYMSHLADCEKCRKNLSSLIMLNAKAETETDQAKTGEIVSLPIPWYRKLFVFPNLAYTMGALVLVFSGIAAFTVLQNVSDSQNSEVSQVYEKQPGGKGMSSDGDATVAEPYSSNTMMSNTASMNTAANSSSSNFNSAVPSAPMVAFNSNAARREESDKNLKAETKSLVEQNEPEDLAKTQDSVAAGAPPPPLPAKENKVDGETEKQLSQNSVARKQIDNLPASGRTISAPTATTRADNKDKKVEESRDDAKLKSAETISIGGKNFKRTNNVWYDLAYQGQSTINVTRGTKEYKKLDSGLRSIAENLVGTVIVVWKKNAYRIQ